MGTAELTNAHWRKSTRSGNDPNCVEIANTEDLVGVRDSKHPAPTLAFTPTTWRSFLTNTKNH